MWHHSHLIYNPTRAVTTLAESDSEVNTTVIKLVGFDSWASGSRIRDTPALVLLLLALRIQMNHAVAELAGPQDARSEGRSHMICAQPLSKVQPQRTNAQFVLFRSLVKQRSTEIFRGWGERLQTKSGAWLLTRPACNVNGSLGKSCTQPATPRWAQQTHVDVATSHSPNGSRFLFDGESEKGWQTRNEARPYYYDY